MAWAAALWEARGFVASAASWETRGFVSQIAQEVRGVHELPVKHRGQAEWLHETRKMLGTQEQ